MVAINSGHHLASVIFQDGCEVRVGYITIFASADAILSGQRAAIGSAGLCARSVAKLWAGIHEYLRYIPVLINNVPQAVELVASFDVVSSPPATLEEGDVLVELIVLAGIELSESRLVRSRRLPTARPCKVQGVRIAGVIKLARRCSTENKIDTAGWPTEVMVVVEEVAEACGRNNLRRQADLGAHVVCRVRLREAETVRKRSQRSVDRLVEETVYIIGRWQVDATLALILVQPRSEDANLRGQRGVQPGGTVVLLVVLGKLLIAQRRVLTRDGRISFETNGRPKVHGSAG